MTMRFGFAQPPLPRTDETVALVTVAQDCGFDSAWVADQTFQSDPYVVLAAAAERTSDVELCVGLTNPTTRHPAVTARAIASLAGLAGPRVALGLGVGNTQELLRPLGLLAERPAVSCREALLIVRALLAGERVAWEGEVFQVDGVELEVEGDAQIPLLVGGRGEHVLRLAGRHADGVILSLAGLDRAWEIVSSAATAAGRPPESIRRVAWGECVPDPSAEDMQTYRRHLGHVLGRAPEAGLRVMGIDPERTAALKEAYRASGIDGAARHVTDDMLSRHMVLGSTDECLDRLRALADAGVDDFAMLVKASTFAQREEILRRFAAKVLAEFR